MKHWARTALRWVYMLGIPVTFIALIIRDWSDFNWWNWIMVIPIDAFLSLIWPIYWIILHGLFGMS